MKFQMWAWGVVLRLTDKPRWKAIRELWIAAKFEKILDDFGIRRAA